jgi:hypothetical protein
VTVANWIALLVPVVGFLGALATYAFQKRLDRKDAVLVDKKRAYVSFLNALFDHAEHRNEKTRIAYDRSKVELVLVAPDTVVKELVWVQEAATMDMDALGPGDVHDRVIGLIVAMRKDCFENSEIGQSEMEYVTPIGRPTPLTAEPEGHYEP